jgi:Protein of unknown function (DUF1493)
MINKPEEIVIQFIQEVWPYAAGITLTSKTTMDELGIGGIDAEDFMEKYTEKFSVEFPYPFDYQKHFAPENIDVIGLIKEIFNNNKEREKFYSLTINDLVIAAKNKIWHYPSQ